MADARPAYLIPEFLASHEARPLRILSEYLEPMRRFDEESVEDTVAFFGSARVQSQRAAVRALKREQTRSPRRAERLRRCRQAVEWSRYYEEAREVARLLTEWSVGLAQQRHRFADALADRLQGLKSSARAAVRGSWRRRTAARTTPAGRRSV